MGISADNKKGSALILVLWIIGMLSMITLSFVFDAHLEGKIVSFSRKQLKCEVLANSGIELAKSYLHRSRLVTGNESCKRFLASTTSVPEPSLKSAKTAATRSQMKKTGHSAIIS